MQYFDRTMNNNNVKSSNEIKLCTISVDNPVPFLQKSWDFNWIGLWLFCAMVNVSHAKDLGIISKVFPITEKSFASLMQERLQAISEEDMRRHKQAIIQKTKESIQRPKMVNLPKATSYREFTYNPSITTTKDITHNNKVLIAKGATANPLELVSLSRPILFLDGDDKDSVNWAKSQRGIWVLTKGAPLKLSEEINQNVYFDQYGKLTTKLGIEAVPAKVSQLGDNLIVEEIVL